MQGWPLLKNQQGNYKTRQLLPPSVVWLLAHSSAIEAAGMLAETKDLSQPRVIGMSSIAERSKTKKHSKKRKERFRKVNSNC